MLDAIKRLFTVGPPPQPSGAGDEVAAWAASRRFGYREIAGNGFIVDGRVDETPWRIEWGPAQRSYIDGSELRLRADLGLPGDLQVALMNRELQQALEAAVFDRYVEGVKTRIDEQTPPEMRWLVMFPRLAGSEMGPLRDRLVALASVKGWLVRWLDGPLTPAIDALRLDPSIPVVITIGRGRLTLRTALVDPELRTVQTWLRLFETALREAQRVAASFAVLPPPDTGADAWPVSTQPGERLVRTG